MGPGAGGRFRLAEWSVVRLGCGGVTCSVKTFLFSIFSKIWSARLHCLSRRRRRAASPGAAAGRRLGRGVSAVLWPCKTRVCLTSESVTCKYDCSTCCRCSLSPARDTVAAHALKSGRLARAILSPCWHRWLKLNFRAILKQS